MDLYRPLFERSLDDLADRMIGRAIGQRHIERTQQKEINAVVYEMGIRERLRDERTLAEIEKLAEGESK